MGFEIFDSGIFWVRNFGKYFFGYLVLSRDFWGVLKRISSALAVYCSSANKVQTNVFCCCLIVNYGVARVRHGIFWGLIVGPGFFWGFAGSARDFFGS